MFGLLIVGCGLGGLFLIPWMAYRRWFRYEPLLYWVSCLMVMCPLFLPYFGGERVYLLLMLRFLVPVVALGLPVLFNLVRRLGGGWCLMVGTLGIFFSVPCLLCRCMGGFRGQLLMSLVWRIGWVRFMMEARWFVFCRVLCIGWWLFGAWSLIVC